MLDKISDYQKEFSSLLNIAEKNIKEAEVYLDFNNEALLRENDAKKGLLFPAVNELRCAAYHIGEAFSLTEDHEKIENYIRANRHCKRATYEALNSLIQFYIKECRGFQHDYRKVLLIDIVPDYIEDCRQLNVLKKQIPTRSSILTSEDYYTKMQTILAEIREIYEKWDASRQEINKKLITESQSRFYKLIACLAAIATIVSTIIGAIAFWA